MWISNPGVISDTVKTAVEAAKKQDTSWIMHHVLDARELDFTPFGVIHLPELHLFGMDISLTKHVVFMWLAFVILVVTFLYVARSYKKSLVPRGITNLTEILIVFVRDEIVKPTIGKGYERFLPYLLTIFFFILTCNFLGLIPYGSTATSNIAVTATLAIISFIVIQVGGMMKNGVFGYFKGISSSRYSNLVTANNDSRRIAGSLHKAICIGYSSFANMTAGHIVIMALLGLIFILHTYFVVPVSIAFALFIFLLEILVALIQAYIFTMLSSLFIGMAVHQEH